MHLFDNVFTFVQSAIRELETEMMAERQEARTAQPERGHLKEMQPQIYAEYVTTKNL